MMLSGSPKEGLIVGGAWYEVFTQMRAYYGEDQARLKAGEIFVKHLVSTESYRDSYLAALAIDDDEGNLSNCRSHFCFFNIAFSRRRLVEEYRRCSQMASDRPLCSEATIFSQVRKKRQANSALDGKLERAGIYRKAQK